MNEHLGNYNYYHLPTMNIAAAVLYFKILIRNSQLLLFHSVILNVGLYTHRLALEKSLMGDGPNKVNYLFFFCCFCFCCCLVPFVLFCFVLFFFLLA